MAGPGPQGPQILTFNEWFQDLEDSDIWERCPRNNIIGFAPVAVDGLYAIVKELNSINDRQRFNGDLIESIRFHRVLKGRHPRLKVRFVIDRNSLAVKYPNVLGADLAKECLIEDLVQLHRIVDRIASKFPPPFMPHVVSLFNHPEYIPQAGISFDEVRKLCFLTYTHPIFFDKKRWAKFVYKLHEIELRNDTAFRGKIHLSTAPTSMVSWVTRVPLDLAFPDDSDHQSPLRQVLYDRTQKFLVAAPQTYPYRQKFNVPSNVPVYLRIVLEHGRDLNPHRWFGKNLKLLRERFDDALPKIHLSLMIGLKDDVSCRADFGADLVKMLRHSTFGYKGFKP